MKNFDLLIYSCLLYDNLIRCQTYEKVIKPSNFLMYARIQNEIKIKSTETYLSQLKLKTALLHKNMELNGTDKLSDLLDPSSGYFSTKLSVYNFFCSKIECLLLIEHLFKIVT